MKAIKSFIFIVFLTTPFFVIADIRITEIMYNALGSGSSEVQDFVELQNTGDVSLDLSSFKFSDGSDHSISSFESSSTLIPPQGIAILVSNPSKFLLEWPNFNGTLLDSSVAFTTTDIASIKNEGGEALDSVSFNSDMGANNDGNSLQLINGQWVSFSPTPGESDVTDSDTPQSQGSSNINSSSTENQSETTTQASSPVFEQQIFANAGADKTTLVGAETMFNGSALGIKKEPLINARYIWNFGDGSFKEGKSVMHTYYFPGTYTVSLDVSSGEYSQGDIAIITVAEAQIKVGEIVSGGEGYITISNNGNTDANISKFVLQSATSAFIFPTGTIIKGKTSIRFPNINTKLSGTSPVSLLYPNYTPVKTAVKNSTESIVAQTVITAQSNRTASVSLKKEVEPVSKVSENEESINKELLGAVGESSSGANLLWITLAVILMGVSIVTVLYSRRERSEADLYEITEVEE